MPGNGNGKTLLWKVLALVFIGFDLILAVALYIALARQPGPSPVSSSTSYGQNDDSRPRVRQRTLFPDGGASATDYSIFAPLSPTEQTRVRDFVVKKRRLKPYDTAALHNLSDPYIYLIELLPPRKREAVAFLDGRVDSAPERTARVVLFNGALPAVEELEVGPVESPSWLRPLLAFGSDKTKHQWTARPTDGKEYMLMAPLVSRELRKANFIWKESFDAEICETFFPQASGGKCLILIDISPRGYKTGQRTSWGYFLRSYDGYLMHSVPLLLQFQHNGVNPSTWGVVKVQYGDTKFPSIDALVKAYKSGSVTKITVPSFPNDKPIFSDMQYDGSANAKVNTRGPLPNVGNRFSLVGNRLSYMDWSAHLGIRTGHGLAFFDVRFGKERIAYEISNMEASVFYSGRTPISGNSQYFDNAYTGMGLWSYELVPGIDCPPGATFLDTSFFVDGGSPKVNRRAVCIFEWNTGTPLGRHLDNDLGGGWFRYGGVPDHVLVVRQIATVVNYDYVFDILFHLDGSIEVKISATGFLQSGFTSAVEREPKVAPNIVGQLHQHLFNWKLDLDIKGEKNAFSEISFPTVEIPHPAFPEYGNRTILTHKYTLKTTEKAANVRYNFRNPKYYLLHAGRDDHKGYRIIMDNLALQPLPENQLAEAAGSFARYPISVTRRKDRMEETSTSLYSQNDGFYASCPTQFSKFYADDESIVDEDLVAWVSQTMIHLPHTEDVPVTTTPTSTIRFYIQPYNFFSSNPMTRLKDTVILQPLEGGRGSKVTSYVGHRSNRDFRLMANFNGTYYYP